MSRSISRKEAQESLSGWSFSTPTYNPMPDMYDSWTTKGTDNEPWWITADRTYQHQLTIKEQRAEIQQLRKQLLEAELRQQQHEETNTELSDLLYKISHHLQNPPAININGKIFETRLAAHNQKSKRLNARLEKLLPIISTHLEQFPDTESVVTDM